MTDHSDTRPTYIIVTDRFIPTSQPALALLTQLYYFTVRLSFKCLLHVCVCGGCVRTRCICASLAVRSMVATLAYWLSYNCNHGRPADCRIYFPSSLCRGLWASSCLAMRAATFDILSRCHQIVSDCDVCPSLTSVPCAGCDTWSGAGFVHACLTWMSNSCWHQTNRVVRLAAPEYCLLLPTQATRSLSPISCWRFAADRHVICHCRSVGCHFQHTFPVAWRFWITVTVSVMNTAMRKHYLSHICRASDSWPLPQCAHDVDDAEVVNL